MGDIGKLIAMGVLSHFGLLAGKSLASGNNDWCPYGTPEEGDICDPNNGNWDICRDGHVNNDSCPEKEKNPGDICPTGTASYDHCPASGTHNDDDECWGGGSKTGTEEQDKCNPDGGGDKCSPYEMPGYGGHDNCFEDPSEGKPDGCNAVSDDTCITGIGGSGPNDRCWSVVGQFTDKCFDGSDDQDECIGGGEFETWGRNDVCFGDSTDHCGGLLHPGDEDDCRGGLSPDDQCPPGKEDDVCFDHVANSDECRGGRESEDREGGSS
jgi:hypothetical protein